MSLGFRVGVPGMRVRVSTRGVRASVGPRIARVHVGTGRTTVSSGLGPFYSSTSLGGSRRRTGPSTSALQRQERAYARAQADAEKAQASAAMERLLNDLVTVHRDNWPAPSRPRVPAPPEPDLKAAVAEITRALTRDVGWTKRKQRAAASETAQQMARRYVADERSRLSAWHTEAQRGADAWWAALLAGDELVVCEALNGAFSDNPAGGVAVGFRDGTASVVIRQPDFDELPEHRPETTAAGRPTLRKMLVRDRRTLYLDSLASNVAATLREALVVAPCVQQVSVCVLSRTARAQALGAVLAGTWRRMDVERVAWGTRDDALRLVTDGAVELQLQLSAAGEVKQLSSHAVPGLDDLLREAQEEPELPEFARPAADLASVRSVEEWSREAEFIAGSAPPDDLRPLRPGEVAVLPGPVTVDIEMTTRGMADADLSVLLLGDDGRARQDSDFVFYNAPSSPRGAARVLSAQLHAGGATHHAVVDLKRLEHEGVGRCVVVVSSEVPLAAHVVLVRDDDTAWSAPIPAEPGLTAWVAVELYVRRRPDGDEWRLRGVGQGWSDGLAGVVRSYGISVH